MKHFSAKLSLTSQSAFSDFLEIDFRRIILSRETDILYSIRPEAHKILICRSLAQIIRDNALDSSVVVKGNAVVKAVKQEEDKTSSREQGECLKTEPLAENEVTARKLPLNLPKRSGGSRWA